MCFLRKRKKKLIDETLVEKIKAELGLAGKDFAKDNVAENKEIDSQVNLGGDNYDKKDAGLQDEISGGNDYTGYDDYDDADYYLSQMGDDALAGLDAGNEENFDYEPMDDSSFAPLDEKDFDIPDDPLPKEELSNLSKRRIWGALVLKLRELGFMTLHSACAEVRDLNLVDGVLTAGVKDEFAFKILTDKENFDKISLALKQIDDRITLKFVLKKSSTSSVAQNLEILRRLFGDELTLQ